MNTKKREEAANIALGNSLAELLGRSFEVQAEAIIAGKLPDITVRKNNIRIVLEAKGDNFKAAAAAAQKRWDEIQPPPDMVGAVSYAPPYLYDFDDAVRRGETIDFALSGDRNDNLAAMKRTGGIYDLAQALRRPHSIIAPGEDDDIDKAIATIRGALALFCNQMKRGKPGQLARLAKLFQADFGNGAKEEEVMEQTALMTGLVLLGAVLFHTVLAAKNPQVSNVRAVLKDKGSIPALRAHWREIMETINYAAIFNLAAEVLEHGIDYSAVDGIVQAAEQVEHVAHDGVDLMGRIYHELLTDAKSLGAFYTSIPSATLMAALALDRNDWRDTNWANADSVGKLRIADPACGSGTLLAAASWQVLDNFSRAYFQQNGGRFGGIKTTHPRSNLQRLLIENVVWGYDILETAAHLSAAALGMMSPETDFRKAHIYRTIIGDVKDGTAAGSLELLEGNMPIYRRDEQIEKGHNEPLPPLDLCIMNPPFVRGQKGHESFSFLSPREQKNVHARMRELGKRHGFTGDKGQGAGFMALACLQRTKTSFIREGGKLAAILPASAAVGMGKAWSGVRRKIEKDFDLETIIVSREKQRPNFSENTALQECILIARRRGKEEQPQKTAMFVVLQKNPATVGDALATAAAITRAKDNKKAHGDLYYAGAPSFKRKVASRIIGQYALLPWHNKSAWRGVSFANLQLAFAAESLIKSGDAEPFVGGEIASLVQLGNIASIGSCRLDIYLGNSPNTEEPRARLSNTITRYAGYYPGHHMRATGVSQKDLRHIAEKPQCYWLPLPGKEKWATGFYKKAGRIALCQSFGFTTMRRLAVLLSEPVQASHYWPIKLNNENEDKLKTLTLWLNSTPALLLIAHASSSTKGAKVGFSQKAAAELMVPDLDNIGGGKLKKAAKVFDDIAKGPGLLPLPQMTIDGERKKIDDVFSQMFGIGELSALREALAAEPIISGA